jgi:hypothetical protein
MHCSSPSDPSTSLAAAPAVSSAPASVHAAGISEREPSGSTKIKSRLPCLRIQPNTRSDCPTNG